MSNTSLNTAQLRRANVWSQQLKDVLLDELMAQQWVNWLSEFPDGDQFNIPSIGDLPTRDYTENTAVEYDQIDTGNFTFVINKYKSSATYITKKAMQDSYYMSQLVSSFVPKEARSLAEVLETDILALATGGASGGQTANDANTLNGAAHRFIGTGTGATLAVADFAKALYGLKKANVPDTALIAFVDPSVEYFFNTQPNFVNFSNNIMWEGVVTSGIASGRKFFKNIYGFDVYTSNYLPSGLAEFSDTGLVANVMFSAAGQDLLPFMGAWRQMPEVDTDYNKDFQREEYVTTARYGLKVYRPENLIVALSDPAVA